MKFMADQPDGYYPLAIVDPPYGIGASNYSNGSSPNRNDGKGYPSTSTAVKSKKNRLNQGSGKLKNRMLNKSNCEWDTLPPTEEYFKEIFRVSKNQIIWGGNYFNLPPTRGIICWDKQQPWENFSQFELAWTSFDKPAKMFRHSNTGGNNNVTKIHPTEKPIVLYKWLLEKYAKPGDKILDTHGGSFSHAIACYDLGFDLDICEKDPDYYKDATDRLNNHILKCEEIKEFGFAKSELNKDYPTLF